MRLLAAGIGASILVTGWLGYRAVDGWRRSATLLARQRASETADRLATVLGRDMRGVQTTVLASAQWDQFMLDPPFDVRHDRGQRVRPLPLSRVFLRVEERGRRPTAVVFLDRVRPPAAMDARGRRARPGFRWWSSTNAAVAAALLARIRKDAALGRRYSVFETDVRGERYQVVARLLYRDALRERLEGVFGFTVNLDVGPPALLSRGRQPGCAHRRLGSKRCPLAVIDAAGNDVAGAAAEALRPPIARRSFPLAFFDPFALDARSRRTCRANLGGRRERRKRPRRSATPSSEATGRSLSPASRRACSCSASS